MERARYCGVHYDPRYSRGRGRRIKLQVQSKQKCEILFTEQTKSKRTWGVAQVVVHLPNKLKALSLIPSTTKVKKKKCRRTALDKPAGMGKN
jgi:hypothetical protein